MTVSSARTSSEFSRAELAGDLRHDYSTSAAGAVPADRRRSQYHFIALWVTFAAGFTYLFLGFQYHDAGYSLWKSVGIGALGALAYLAYALPAAYLGSTTGRTHALLTRSIFGSVGSVLVSLLLIGIAAGWTAFAFNLLANLYDGLFSWGHIVLISVLLAVVGITNNLLGFTGITAFARYLVAPVMIAWVLYLVIKGLLDIPSARLDAAPAVPDGSAPMGVLAGISTAIGSVMWGNEPDTWRYGRPRFTWPLVPYVIALAVGLVLFVAGGWMMAELSGAGQYDFGPAFRYTVHYSLFGALWLGAIVATVLQIAINDGNYYEMVNGGQNILGHAPGWRRWYTCVLVTAIAAVFAWRFPHLENGFFKVAGWSAVALPSATVVMCVDVFVLPRVLGLARPLDEVPSWRSAGVGNWPAIVSVAAAVLFGAWGLMLFPGQTSAPDLGLVPVEAWIGAGLLYLGLAAAASRAPGARTLLGYGRPGSPAPAAPAPAAPAPAAPAPAAPAPAAPAPAAPDPSPTEV
jgi:purine-cytosine permease-like protein